MAEGDASEGLLSRLGLRRELLLRWRKSALLQKISLFERLQTRVRDFLKRF